MLNKILKLSSIFGAALIFCGVLKLQIYYSAFDIDIIDFLVFSEIVTSFLDDINILLIFLGAMIIQTMPLLHILHDNSTLRLDEFITQMERVIFPHRYKFAIFFIIVLTSICILLFTNLWALRYGVIYFIILCIIQIFTYILLYENEEGEITIHPSHLVGAFTIGIVTSIFLLAMHDIQNVKRNELSVIIEIRNAKIICNKYNQNLYLGKTSGYVFVRNVKNKSTLSIPISEVQSLEFIGEK